MVKPPKIRFQKAYRPIFPAHLNAAPTYRLPKLPPLLPFFKLKTHTVPTKWSLYRPLLRATHPTKGASDGENPSPDDGLPNLRRHLRAQWKKARPWTSIVQTRDFLAKQYDLLDALTSSSKQTVLTIRRRERSLRRLYTHVDARQSLLTAQPRPKSRLVGGYIYPTVYNPPIPRLKPQPPHISGMISRRIAARERRLHKMRLYQTYMDDMTAESALEAGLGLRRESNGFDAVVREMIGDMQTSFEREKRREAKRFTVRDVERVEKARKDKFRRAGIWRREAGQKRRDAEQDTQTASGGDLGTEKD